MRREEQGRGVLWGRTSTFWGQLWKLHISNTEKHFLWRACNEILPTRVNLYSRRVNISPTCPICEKKEETTFHILWQCPSAQDVWGASCATFQKSIVNGPNFLSIVEEMWTKCNKTEFALFAGIAWQIWLRRNELLHGGTFYTLILSSKTQLGRWMNMLKSWLMLVNKERYLLVKFVMLLRSLNEAAPNV